MFRPPLSPTTFRFQGKHGAQNSEKLCRLSDGEMTKALLEKKWNGKDVVQGKGPNIFFHSWKTIFLLRKKS